MKLFGHTKEMLSMVQDILTAYLGSPRKMSPPEELILEGENPAGVTQHAGGMRLAKAKGRLSSRLLACNKLTADS